MGVEIRPTSHTASTPRVDAFVAQYCEYSPDVDRFGELLLFARELERELIALVSKTTFMALTETDKEIIEWCAQVCETTENAPDAGLREVIWHEAALVRAAAAIRALKDAAPHARA